MEIIRMIVEAYLIWVLTFFILTFILNNKRILSLSLTYGLLFLFIFIGSQLKIPVFVEIFKKYDVLLFGMVLMIVILTVPDIRILLENMWKPEIKQKRVVASTQTKQNIVDAAFSLSAMQVGALITIEKHNTLDPYAERAIVMNCDVSKEVLINIFTPNTPLHDGAVIIRGDKILCAGAYFVLSDKENLGKTMGSRHRAGLGISEVTDSLTVLVSEETGRVSVAFEGILLPMNDKEKLMEYVGTFMK